MPRLAIDPQAIEREAQIREISAIAAYLEACLGTYITTYVSGLDDPSAIVELVSKESGAKDIVQFRLRTAYQIATLIERAYDATTAKAWFFGSNTRLDDEAPAYLLRHAETPDDFRFLIPTARAFAGVAY